MACQFIQENSQKSWRHTDTCFLMLHDHGLFDVTRVDKRPCATPKLSFARGYYLSHLTACAPVRAKGGSDSATVMAAKRK